MQEESKIQLYIQQHQQIRGVNAKFGEKLPENYQLNALL